MAEKTILGIQGMHCQHCVQAVEEAIGALPGVEKVKVDLKRGEAKIKHSAEVGLEHFKAAVTSAGFTA